MTIDLASTVFGEEYNTKRTEYY